MQTPQTEHRNRYPGVKPFTSDERGIVFGREKDTEDLYSLLFISRPSCCTAKSGYGKKLPAERGHYSKAEGRRGMELLLHPVSNNFSERDAKENLSPMENIKLRAEDGPR